jgi:hypothetical protein
MKTLQEESIPQFVTLLKCEKCCGIFTFADDLVNFKKAQKTKLHFYKTWQLPFPSLKTVLVYSFILFTTVSILYSLTIINVRQSMNTQAEDVVKSIKISKIENVAVVYFTTKGAFRSKAIFYNQTTGQQTQKAISDKLTTVHFLTVSDITTSESITLQIILTSGQISLKTQPITFLPR